MTILQAIILGIVEGIAEFLPISSTAHLLISSELLGVSRESFLETFINSVRLGAILSVAVLYFKLVWNNKKIILKLATAFLPTAVIGLLTHSLISNLFTANQYIYAIATALIVGGILIIILENYFKKRDKKLEDNLHNISYRQAFLIGVFQILAIFPGVSRSASTIMAGLYLGISRKAIVEFSFILAVPVMLAATGFNFYKIFVQAGESINSQEWLALSAGFIFAFVTAILGIKLLLGYIKNNNFKIFGWYRILIGSIVIIWQLLI